MAAKSGNGKRDASLGVSNTGTTYTASVGVGSPPTQYKLIVDTGSSNTWVGVNGVYVQTSTSHATSDKVSVTYGSGSFSGQEYTDDVTLGSLTIKSQSIGVASSSSGFDGADGILGIGPVDLTKGTLSPDDSATIPTVVDNLYSQGSIQSSVLGVQFKPVGILEGEGKLDFGAVDTEAIDGDVMYVPITTTSPANEFWGIDQSITYGDSTSILSSTAGIVDTGSTLVLIATDAFERYQQATGAVTDNVTGLLRITLGQYENLKDLNFNIGGATFPLTPNAQIFPRSLNAEIGGSTDAIYLMVGDLGSSSGDGLDFINGYAFLERYYSVYDTDNKRVGLARTGHTDSKSN
ncbi:aspartic proteinase [Coniophora puteana RWD-64-598 SS2]|uniref:Aspartic proteinase n=1 Tax=Coniophora puteana (strain RWD-64-598) TaxID=741705 RepID=A0A5M3MP68_CONPW|nr:aspartic proteinase [Coniophora puteana RWD-64-598 SS2]EIW80837.1 aspartic proteinase [Coniophora puteana RWD-64-598 SS2]